MKNAALKIAYLFMRAGKRTKIGIDMTKRFLLDQKISKRINPALTRVRDRTRAALRTAYRGGVRAVLGWIFRGTAAPYAASALVVVGGTLAVILAVSAPRNAEPQAQEPSPRAPVLTIGAGDPASQEVLGGPVINRDVENVHTVRDGETFSEIASIYDISPDKLAAFNKITNPDKIREGTVIRIPTRAAEKNIKVPPAAQPRSPAAARGTIKPPVSGGTLKILSDLQQDGPTVTAHFQAVYPAAVKLSRFEWSLGDGKMAFKAETYYTYQDPGTYTVRLRAFDGEGRMYTADDLHVDVPHPTTYQTGIEHFITLESIDRLINVAGSVTQLIHYDGRTDPPMLPVSTNTEGSTTYRATRPGFFGFDVDEWGITHHWFVFVSPIDSKHSDRTDINWYRTQFNTGTQSNCGPASASMAIAWSTGEYVPVSQIRDEIGWVGNGSTSFEDLMKNMAKHKTPSVLFHAIRPQDIMEVIDRGNIAIVLYDTSGVRKAKGNPGQDLFGSYYQDDVGHYLIIKGYSRDQNYFVCYDAIPSDWSSNQFRYPDGISMIGRNRYYNAMEIFRSLRRADVIEVMRPD
jgi:LysM repeat protein